MAVKRDKVWYGGDDLLEIVGQEGAMLMQVRGRCNQVADASGRCKWQTQVTVALALALRCC